MNWRRKSFDPAVLAGLFVVWAVAWSVAPGRVAADTKTDLYVDPWGFLSSALHAWDPQVTWGGLQNQAYGYLFPMGPFFGIGSQILPMWVVQRLWWATLLTAGFVATLGLLRALDVAGPRVRIVAALAYTLSPRVVSTIATVSSEAQAQLLAPAILWPLVLVDRGRLSARRGAALSGLAILCCGGVNATATACAVLPSALWLLTRRSWWRRPVTWLWGVMVLGATSWWLVPLVVLGRYSPPFLDWIENAQTVSAQITSLDTLRGTTHWLGHLVTSAGEWWPAGRQLVASPTSILLTTGVMALGLAGLTLRRLPHRTFLLSCLAVGVLAISLPHRTQFGSPVVGIAQAALDGSLAPLRNVHKADLLVRLPLVVGLAHVLHVVAGSTRLALRWRQGLIATVAVLVVGAASPAFSGAIAARGTFTEMAPQWRDLGRWLDQRPGERALVVPASSFGEYVWGRTMDEPLRPLTTAAYAVRDAVPLAPAGTIRLLDEVEARLQTGRSLEGASAMLRAAGVRHIVVRNDLQTGDSGQPPVALSRSAVTGSPDIAFAKGFGSTWLDASGQRVFPVEVYTLRGDVAPDVAVWDARDALGATGATEDLARLADAGLGGRPVIFDGDRTPDLQPTRSVVTDGFRARTRWFGAPRGQDVTSALTAKSAREAPDYLSWPGVERRSVVTYDGIQSVGSSSSIATDYGVAGLQPAHRAFAALDGDSSTSWVTVADPEPELTIHLEEPRDLGEVSVLPLVDRRRFGQALGVVTRVRVTTQRGSVEADLETGGSATRVALPKGTTGRVSVRVLDTTEGPPRGTVTGLAELTIPGVRPREVVQTPRTYAEGSADSAVLGAGLAGRDGCSVAPGEIICLTGQLLDPESSGPMVRDVAGLGAGRRTLRGTLAVDPQQPPSALTDVPGVSVRVSSQRGYAPTQLPSALVDSDERTAWSPSPDDRSPSVTLTLDEQTPVEGVRLQVRGDWARLAAPAVIVDIDGTEFTRRLPAHGVLTFPPTSGRQIALTFVDIPAPGRQGLASLQLEEVEIVGHPFAAPAQSLSAECGRGPRLTVDGRTVPTSATSTRDALLGLGDITWQACEDVDVAGGALHRVELGGWAGLVPRSAVMTPATPTGPAPTSAAVSTPVDTTRVSPTELRGSVGPGPQRLVVMTDNANAGWEARVNGTRLPSQVVDGRRQGFVVPAGSSGTLAITFTPDHPYRWGLFLGAALAALVVLAAAWPGGGRRPETGRRGAAVPSRGWRRVGEHVAPLVVAGLVAGPVGLVIGAVALVVARLAGRGPVLGGLVVALGMSAAVVQAWAAPGGVGGSPVASVVWLLVVGAFVLALAAATQEPTGEA